MHSALRPATLEDALYLSTRLRQADVDELKAGCGSSPHDALHDSLTHSQVAYTGVAGDGEPVIMFGVAEFIPNLLGAAWMLSSDRIYENIVPFLKHSRPVIDKLNERWPVLFNYCDERNRDHVEWMLWLDYTFIARHETFGVEKRPFLEFVRTKSNVWNRTRNRELRRQRRIAVGLLPVSGAGGE